MIDGWREIHPVTWRTRGHGNLSSRIDQLYVACYKIPPCTRRTFGEAYSNCKWSDQASQCSVWDEHWYDLVWAFAVDTPGLQGYNGQA